MSTLPVANNDPLPSSSDHNPIETWNPDFPSNLLPPSLVNAATSRMPLTLDTNPNVFSGYPRAAARAYPEKACDLVTAPRLVQLPSPYLSGCAGGPPLTTGLQNNANQHSIHHHDVHPVNSVSEAAPPPLPQTQSTFVSRMPSLPHATTCDYQVPLWNDSLAPANAIGSLGVSVVQQMPRSATGRSGSFHAQAPSTELQSSEFGGNPYNDQLALHISGHHSQHGQPGHHGQLGLPGQYGQHAHLGQVGQLGHRGQLDPVEQRRQHGSLGLTGQRGPVGLTGQLVHLGHPGQNALNMQQDQLPRHDQHILQVQQHGQHIQHTQPMQHFHQTDQIQLHHASGSGSSNGMGIGDTPVQYHVPRHHQDVFGLQEATAGESLLAPLLNSSSPAGCFDLMTRCGELFHSKRVRGKQVLSPNEKSFACLRCPSRFKTRSDINRHNRIVHLKEKPYKCTVETCRSRFAEKGKLKRHTETVHDKLRPHVCHTCGAAFGERGNLNQHMSSRHGASVVGHVVQDVH